VEQRENSYGKDANTALGTEQLPVLQALGWTCTLLLFSLHCKECLLLQWAIFCFDVALNPPQTAQHVDRRQWSVHARGVWHLLLKTQGCPCSQGMEMLQPFPQHQPIPVPTQPTAQLQNKHSPSQVLQQLQSYAQSLKSPFQNGGKNA